VSVLGAGEADELTKITELRIFGARETALELEQDALADLPLRTVLIASTHAAATTAAGV
tara:strand:- start:54 stop:230 length:177 start_codon:yes stop_codon:yes gene_type:complete